MTNHRLWLGLMSVAFILGCGDSGAAPHDPTFDPSVARSALVESLEAWKAGRVKALKERTPPIRFEDDDLATGFLLTSFDLPAESGPRGSHEGVLVRLSLRDRKGKMVERRATYQVSTSPSLNVLRSDP
jgi:hypothetical protein